MEGAWPVARDSYTNPTTTVALHATGISTTVANSRIVARNELLNSSQKTYQQLLVFLKILRERIKSILVGSVSGAKTKKERVSTESSKGRRLGAALADTSDESHLRKLLAHQETVLNLIHNLV
jgi:hypothetical protein